MISIIVYKFKYSLDSGIDCAEDIRKLDHLASLDQPLYLMTDMFTGDWDEGVEFRINSNTNFVLAVVAWAGTKALSKDVWKHHNKKSGEKFVYLVGKIDHNIQSEFIMLNY